MMHDQSATYDEDGINMAMVEELLSEDFLPIVPPLVTAPIVPPQKQCARGRAQTQRDRISQAASRKRKHDELLSLRARCEALESTNADLWRMLNQRPNTSRAGLLL
jgi:hypothetical protein